MPKIGDMVRITWDGNHGRWKDVIGVIVNDGSGSWQIEVPDGKASREFEVEGRKAKTCCFGAGEFEVLASLPEFKVGDSVKVVGAEKPLRDIFAPVAALGKTGIVRELLNSQNIGIHINGIGRSDGGTYWYYPRKSVIPATLECPADHTDALACSCGFATLQPSSSLAYTQLVLKDAGLGGLQGRFEEVEEEVREVTPTVKLPSCTNTDCIDGILHHSCNCTDWCPTCYSKEWDGTTKNSNSGVGRNFRINESHDKGDHTWLSDGPDPKLPHIVKRKVQRFIPTYSPPNPTGTFGYEALPSANKRACRECGLKQPCMCAGLKRLRGEMLREVKQSRRTS